METEIALGTGPSLALGEPHIHEHWRGLCSTT